MIELQGKDRIWQTLCKTMTSSYTDTKRNYPFPFVDELWIPMQPFPNPCGSWFEKLELTIQPEYKIYQTLDAINIIPYLTFLQARECGIFVNKNWTEVLCLIWWISAKLFQKWNKKMLTDKQVDRCQNWRQILIKNCHVSQVS